MFAKTKEIEERYNEIERHLGRPEIIQNQEIYQKYIKEHSFLTPIVTAFRKYQSVQDEIESNISLLNDPDPEMRKLAREEIDMLRSGLTQLEKDGADGIRSVVRAHIGGPTDVADSGDMAFRTLLDGDAVRRDPATRFVVDWQAGNVWFGPGGHLVVYPVRRQQLINVVGIFPISEDVSRDWNRPATHDELMTAYAGWDERVIALLSKADGPIALWALKHQEPFAEWNRGNITLLGDAAHSMVPYVSQGASQSIEDAAVLAEELAGIGPADAAPALDAYVRRRAERARTVQIAAMDNRSVFHLPDGERQRERDARMRAVDKNVDTKLDWIYQGTPLRGMSLSSR
ncbi:MAG: FAD-dependent monooxygenase [Planctomycetota bacterium]|nr:FAD-dependent monooxygenase [Planctomycetota bacterium]